MKRFFGLMACLAAVSLTLAQEPVRDQVYVQNLLRTLSNGLERGNVVPCSTLNRQLSSRSGTSLRTASLNGSTLEPHEVYERAKRGTVIVGGAYLCPDCEEHHMGTVASGWVLSADGIIVTNYHVIEGDDNDAMAVATFDGQVHPIVEVLAANRRDDVAIVRVDANDLTPLPLKPGATVGSDAYVISHPQSRFFMFTSGHVARYHQIQTLRMSITADYATGSSGGPVLDRYGNVIGMVASTSSLYTSDDDPEHRHLQMVIKDCVPAASIASLLRGG